MKVFISQPMKGLSDEEILNKRNEAITKIKEKFGDDVEIINSIFECPSTERDALKHLARSIMLMADADYVYFINGSEYARGCAIEYICSNNYGIRNNINETRYQNDK